MVVKGSETTFTLSFVKGQVQIDIGGVKTIRTDVDTDAGAEVHISKMAVCVGDMCVPIPKAAKKPQTPKSHTAASKPAKQAAKKPQVPKSHKAAAKAAKQAQNPQVQNPPKETQKKDAAGTSTGVAMERLFGATLIDRMGNRFNTAAKLAELDCIAIYFSAHWCPPCRAFTPHLGHVTLQDENPILDSNRDVGCGMGIGDSQSPSNEDGRSCPCSHLFA